MEWTIPLQNLDITKIKVGKPSQGSKLISPLSYADDNIVFNALTILLPLLPIKSYDAATGRLQILLQGPNVLQKLQQIQEMLINIVYTNQSMWFPNDKSSDKDTIRHGFQPFIEHGILNLFCPCSTVGMPNEIYNYTGKSWERNSLSPSIFMTGKNIRLTIKFQGISFHQHALSKAWTGKFRLQHRIIAIITN